VNKEFGIRPGLFAVLLGAATILIFWPLIGYDFVNYDDTEYASSNWHVLGGLTAANVRWAFGTGYAANWHPLTWLSLMLDVQMFGPGPAGHHLVNVLLHAANAALLFLALVALTGSRYRSALVAALFAFHPLHVESVAWISERKDVLSTLFFIAVLWAYARYSNNPVPGPVAPTPRAAAPQGRSESASRPLRFVQSRRFYYLLGLVFFACSLMSKPMFVTLPFSLLLLDYWPLKRASESGPGKKVENNFSLKRYFWDKTPYLLMSALSCVVTLLVQTKGGAIRTVANLPMVARFENVPVSYVRYLGKAFWPFNLAVLYAHPGRWPLGTVVLSGLTIVTLCLAVLFLRQKFPFMPTGWFWFLGTLVPVIGLVQVGDQSMADRYTYVPLVGIFIILAWGAGELYARWQFPLAHATLIATFSSVLIALAILTRAQLAVWSNGETLFRHAVSVTKDNHMARAFLDNTLGTSLYRQGKIAQAIEDFRSAIQLYPQYPLAWNNLGIALAVKGEVDQAISQYEHALQLAPGYDKAHLNLADAMVIKGRLPEAIDHYRKALESEPASAGAWNNLGSALLRQGQYQEAVESYQRALFFAPNSARAYANLSKALALQGRLEESETNCLKALELDPGSAETHYQMGVLLLKQGRKPEAVDQLTESLRLRPNYPEAIRQLRSLPSEAPQKPPQ